MKGDKKTAAVDFDGTIVKYNGWQNKWQVGGMKGDEHTRKQLQRLKDAGFVVIIYTCRPQSSRVRRILENHDIPYDHINENPHEPDGVADCKIHADWYIDDKCPSFQGLEHAVDLILAEDGGKDD